MPKLIKSMLILFLAQACVGVNIVLSKGLLEHLNPLVILTVRFSIASIFLTVILAESLSVQKTELSNLSKKDWLVMLVEGLGAGVFFNFIMLSGLHYTNANSAGLITSLLPAVVICLNVIIFGQNLSQKMLTSLLISVAGLILINLSAFNGEGRNILLGNLLVLMALIPDGLYYALSKLYPVKVNHILKTFILNAINLPILYIAVLVFSKNNWDTISIHDWLIMITIGITSSLFFIFWQIGIKGIDVAYSALSTAFMPVATVMLAWIILGEGLSITKLAGMLLVILSIVVYARK